MDLPPAGDLSRGPMDHRKYHAENLWCQARVRAPARLGGKLMSRAASPTGHRDLTAGTGVLSAVEHRRRDSGFSPFPRCAKTPDTNDPRLFCFPWHHLLSNPLRSPFCGASPQSSPAYRAMTTSSLLKSARLLLGFERVSGDSDGLCPLSFSLTLFVLPHAMRQHDGQPLPWATLCRSRRRFSRWDPRPALLARVPSLLTRPPAKAGGRPALALFRAAFYPWPVHGFCRVTFAPYAVPLCGLVM